MIFSTADPAAAATGRVSKSGSSSSSSLLTLEALTTTGAAANSSSKVMQGIDKLQDATRYSIHKHEWCCCCINYINIVFSCIRMSYNHSIAK